MSSTGYCIGCCCCTILITTIVILAGSIKTLQVNWYGVDYSAITKTINPTVYTSGIHFVGFGHSFIEYPATIQTLEFSDGDKASSGKIYGRSADGLMDTIEFHPPTEIYLDACCRTVFLHRLLKNGHRLGDSFDSVPKDLKKVSLEVINGLTKTYHSTYEKTISDEDLQHF